MTTLIIFEKIRRFVVTDSLKQSDEVINIYHRSWTTASSSGSCIGIWSLPTRTLPCLLFSWGLENTDDTNTNNNNNLVFESVILMGTLSTHWMIDNMNGWLNIKKTRCARVFYGSLTQSWRTVFNCTQEVFNIHIWRWYKIFFLLFLLLTDVTHYWVFDCPAQIDRSLFGGSANTLFSMLYFCRISWQTLQPITLYYCLLYSVKGSLSHRQRQTGFNAGLEANCITFRLPP